MRPDSAAAWRRVYQAEREALGEAGLARLLDEAPRVSGRAIVFPHTFLAVTGRMVAAAARAVIESGADRVLAIGVLHRGREVDAPLVGRARAGDHQAREALRRVHGPDVPGDEGRWTEEFSLDGFAALLALAARRARRLTPRIVPRFPFLAGDDPRSLPGLGELAAFRDGTIVATADPIHYGVGYDQPDATRAHDDPATRAFACASIEAGFTLLTHGDFAAFATHCAAARSDFRDAGPALAATIAPRTVRVIDVETVDYAATVEAPRPTWVAGALATFD